jgi:O-antigen ligase
LKEGNWRESVFFYALCLVVLTIPFSDIINRYCIGFLAVVWIYNGYFRNIRLIRSLNVGMFFVFYLIYVIGLLYTEDEKNGMFQLEQKLTLIVFPLILVSNPPLTEKKTDLLLYLFAFACCSAGLYSLLNGLLLNFRLNELETLDFRFFTNQQLAGYIGSHSTYLSMYFAFSIGIILSLFRKYGSGWIQNLCTIVALTFMILFLLLLASRIVILVTTLLFLVSIMRALRYRKMKMRFLIAGLLLVMIGAFVISRIDFIRKRIDQLYSFNAEDPIGNQEENGVSQRVFFWRNAIEIIKKKPLLGHGTGDAPQQFRKQYQQLLESNPGYPESVVKAIRFFSENRYNSHNQFLQVMILFGIAGLMIFVFIFGRAYYVSFKQRDWLMFFFVTVVLFTCMTECVLDRQMGVVFFSFFMSFFLLMRLPLLSTGEKSMINQV